MSTPEAAFPCTVLERNCSVIIFLFLPPSKSHTSITLIESKSRGNLGSTVLASQLGNTGGQGHRRWSKVWPSDTREYVIHL